MDSITVGITGASGSVLAKRLLEYLSHLRIKLYVVITDNGRRVFEYETGEAFEEFLSKIAENCAEVIEYEVSDMFAPIASGSFPVDCMAVLPCSMATAAKLATGCGDNLLTRAADVCLKEKTRLVIVPRESPVHAVHLKNLLALSELGAEILLPIPAFYTRTNTLDGIVDELVGRILKSCGFKNNLYKKWSIDDEKN